MPQERRLHRPGDGRRAPDWSWQAAAESLGADLYKVHALVENTGFLPTYGSEAYKATSRCKPVKVTLELGDGMERLMGKEEEDIGHLDGRASQFEAFSVFPAYDNDARNGWSGWCAPRRAARSR